MSVAPFRSGYTMSRIVRRDDQPGLSRSRHSHERFPRLVRICAALTAPSLPLRNASASAKLRNRERRHHELLRSIPSSLPSFFKASPLQRKRLLNSALTLGC